MKRILQCESVYMTGFGRVKCPRNRWHGQNPLNWKHSSGDWRPHSSIRNGRSSTGTDEQYVNPLAQSDGMPGYAVHWMEVEGPLDDKTTGAGYRLLFDNHSMRSAESCEPGVMLEIAAPSENVSERRNRFRFAPRTRDFIVEVESTRPQEDARRLLKRFVTRAYRIPVKTGRSAQTVWVEGRCCGWCVAHSRLSLVRGIRHGKAPDRTQAGWLKVRNSLSTSGSCRLCPRFHHRQPDRSSCWSKPWLDRKAPAWFGCVRACRRTMR